MSQRTAAAPWHTALLGSIHTPARLRSPKAKYFGQRYDALELTEHKRISSD